ncbi:MAG: PspC domain-containing protein [Cryobacterium sp.]
MTDAPSTSSPGTPYGATGQPKPAGGAQFFDWVRGLGFVRGQDRWLAGVCGAIAARTGLDPLIVRGIAVVIAILGGPIFFLYAVGWALIPDERGRSLVEQAVHQVFEPAMIAVGVLLFFTFIPWMQGIWWQGPPEVWGMPGWLEVLLRTSWAIGLTVGIVLLVVYIAKRVPSPRNRPAQPNGGYPNGYPNGGYPNGGYPNGGTPYGSAPSGGYPASAPTAPAAPAESGTASFAAAPSSSPEPGSASAEPSTTDATSGAADSAPTPGDGSTPTETFVPPIPPVPEPPTPTSPTGFAATPPQPSLWDDLTTRGATWQARSNGQSGTAPYGTAPYGTAPYGTAPAGAAPYDSSRFASTPYGSNPYASTAKPASASTFDPHVYRELHRRKHLGAGFISVVAGLALSTGAVAASFVADGAWSNTAYLVGAAAALAVIAVGIIVAGIRGKEGGWLNFFSIVLASTLVWTAFIPTGTDFVTFGDPTWEYDTSDPTGFAMIAGAPVIDLTAIDSTPAATDRTVDIWLAFGDVELVLPDNRTVLVEANNLAGGIDYDTTEAPDLDRRGVLVHDSRVVTEGAGTGVTTVRVWNGFGEVTINQPAEPALR